MDFPHRCRLPFGGRPDDPVLDNLVRTGKLSVEAVAEDEWRGLVCLGLRRLDDAERVELSLESRFDLAYNASHSLALAALRYAGSTVRPCRGIQGPDTPGDCQGRADAIKCVKSAVSLVARAYPSSTARHVQPQPELHGEMHRGRDRFRRRGCASERERVERLFMLHEKMRAPPEAAARRTTRRQGSRWNPAGRRRSTARRPRCAHPHGRDPPHAARLRHRHKRIL